MWYNENMKNAKQLERIFKGAANHTRIEILFLVDKNKELSLIDISEKLKKNFKTLSEHTHRLVKAGLLNKRYRSTTVLHSLSPYGEKVVKFFKEFN